MRNHPLSVQAHYDLLIDENNDPVNDPKPLREYMDQWDGKPFLDALQLDKNKTVLEIGIGTGRLAVKVAPFCKHFTGIDISPKTIERAKQNLSSFSNITLLCVDFLNYSFSQKYDVVYSSLTWMHFAEKQLVMDKAASLLKSCGTFVLSIDKNPAVQIDMGTRSIDIFPDTADSIRKNISVSGLLLKESTETKLAHIFVCTK